MKRGHAKNQGCCSCCTAAWGPLMILISALMLLLGWWWKSARAENERTDRWQLSRFLGLGLTPYWSTTDEAATSTKLWHTCLTSLSTKSDSDNDLLLAKKKSRTRSSRNPSYWRARWTGPDANLSLSKNLNYWPFCAHFLSYYRVARWVFTVPINSLSYRGLFYLKDICRDIFHRMKSMCIAELEFVLQEFWPSGWILPAGPWWLG